MEDRNGERILHLCGTILNRQPLLYCEVCGATLGPARYRDYVVKRTRGISPPTDGHNICEACARKANVLGAHRTMPID